MARQAEAFAEDERLAERYGRTCPGLPDDLVNFHHDPLACAVALGWDGVTIETIFLAPTVAEDWIRMLPDSTGRPFQVVTAVEAARFSSYWLNTLVGSSRREA